MSCTCKDYEAFSTSSMEERSETPVLLIYKVISTTSTTNLSRASKTTYHVRMSKDVKELSIKRSNTVGKIAMSMKRGKSQEVSVKKERRRSLFGPKSYQQQNQETMNGFETIIPESTSLTTHGAEKSNYDNQAYWTEILQTNGGLDLLAQASQDYYGSDIQSISTSSSTSGGADTTENPSSPSKSGALKTSAQDHNSRFGRIGTRSQHKSKEEVSETSDQQSSLYSPTTRLRNAFPMCKIKNQSKEDSKW